MTTEANTVKKETNHGFHAIVPTATGTKPFMHLYAKKKNELRDKLAALDVNFNECLVLSGREIKPRVRMFL